MTDKLKETERAIMKQMDREDGQVLDPEDPTNFNIVPGRPLPEGFKNPPCGTEGHFCVDNGGRYNPDWWQVNIQPRTDYDANPQIFPLSQKWIVYLDMWQDVPREVVDSLLLAEETHHTHNRGPGEIDLSDSEVHKEITRKRFLWSQFPSAKVKE